jgi:uncharacterized OsmC-like protein
MTTSKVLYLGDLRCESTHLASGVTIITDAPVDNFGKGQSFSPTDSVANALGTCILTTVGIKANQNQWNIKGATVEITKIMGSDPRRIIQIDAIVSFPPGDYDDKTKKILENTAITCPVAKSLHPDLVQNVSFKWN